MGVVSYDHAQSVFALIANLLEVLPLGTMRGSHITFFWHQHFDVKYGVILFWYVFLKCM